MTASNATYYDLKNVFDFSSPRIASSGKNMSSARLAPAKRAPNKNGGQKKTGFREDACCRMCDVVYILLIRYLKHK